MTPPNSQTKESLQHFFPAEDESEQQTPPQPNTNDSSENQSRSNNGEKTNGNRSLEEDSGDDNKKDSDEYGTSPKLIKMFQENIPTEKFSLDPASGAEVTQIAEHTFTKEDNGLEHSWAKHRINSIFLNPPYSDVSPWLQRMLTFIDPADEDKADFGIALLRCDTSTNWFHDYIADERVTLIAFPDDRLSFYHISDQEDNDKTNFPCFFALYGDPPLSLVEAIATGCEGQYEKAALYIKTNPNGDFGQTTLDDLLADGGQTLADAYEDTPYWKKPPEGGYASNLTWYLDRPKKEAIRSPHSVTKTRPTPAETQ